MQTVFRAATPDDAPAMVRLVTVAWQTAYRGILSDAYLDGIDPAVRTPRVRESILTDPRFWYYVLEQDGDIVGVSGLCALPDEDLRGAGEIKVFYIRPDKQGQGLGKLMMRHALDALMDRGFPRAALWVLTDNRPARAFYEAMGFAADGAEKTLTSLENAHTVRYRYGEKR
ncbi:MAG: GNAT family N-acetyltransferase [Firmicutes bacterium]|nr:GNAT family N-acetyltransferase [Bacillota bacterium]